MSTEKITVLGHEVNYTITSNGYEDIDLAELLEQAIKDGNKAHEIRANTVSGGVNLSVKIGEWWITDWKGIATDLYEGYKGMINGKPWTDESVKKIDDTMRRYEQAIKAQQ
jgi:hypothetical protein